MEKDINPIPSYRRGPKPGFKQAKTGNPSGKRRADEETFRLRARVLDLRREGMSYAQIARELDKSEGYVYKVYKKALASITFDKIEEVRKLELQRLDDLQAKVSNVLNSFSPLVNQGRIVTAFMRDENGNVVRDDKGEPITVDLEDVDAKLKAVKAALLVMERRARLLGLDAPAKQELSGPNGGPIPTQNSNAPMTLEQLREEAMRRGLPVTVFQS